ncbi:uncharacterized protein TNIN_279561 [Trichonephila inaurata madagascariensis]|uniref:Uncharacterized protein n=1 Tax=Trichonephila inaurata madagascariensis TaxID=2747483 RepID=A0A8X6IMK6_9ARAC|nr:uncharacterized protein TNIN_279561 [Trichonephila inaurata madagascariensis]
MEHTKKFVLVPEERLRQFAEIHLTDLDKEMHKILRKPNLSDLEKATLYTQIFQKYTNFPLPTQNITEPIHEVKSEDFNTNEKKEEFDQMNSSDEIRINIENEILNQTPLKRKYQDEKIMELLQQNSASLSWTNEKELMIKNKILLNTNIVDLVAFLLKDRKTEPNGLRNFIDILREFDFPSQLIKNRYFKYKTTYAKPATWIQY